MHDLCDPGDLPAEFLTAVAAIRTEGTSIKINLALDGLPHVLGLSSAETDGVAGGVTQVRAVTSALTAAAKATGVPLILIGHVTKDGAIAGPRSLEHLVDVVLHFEGDRNSLLRMVRGVKNRYGAADEVGCFLLQDSGIEGVADPSAGGSATQRRICSRTLEASSIRNRSLAVISLGSVCMS